MWSVRVALYFCDVSVWCFVMSVCVWCFVISVVSSGR